MAIAAALGPRADVPPGFPDARQGCLDEGDVRHAVERETLEAAVGADEAGHVLRGRLGQQVGRRPGLGDAAALLHDDHEVAHLDGLVDVMGHEEDRLGEALLQSQELVLETFADDGVDRAEGLVHEHDRRVRGQGASHAHALPLAARELARIALAVSSGLEAHERQELVGARRAGGLGPAQQARHRGHVLGDGLVREEPGLLDDVADAATQLGDVAAADVLPVDEDPAVARLDEPVHHLEGRGLAAARGTDEDADASRGHRQRQVLDRALRRGTARGGGIALADVVELDGGTARGRRCHPLVTHHGRQ